MKKAFNIIIKYFQQSDMLLLVLCCISAVYGIILISSATRYSGGSHSVTMQIISLAVGIVLYVLFSAIDVDIIADKSKLLFILSILFISTLFFWGVAGNSGNSAWLRFGGFGVQPAEIVKIPFIIILAKQMVFLKDRRGYQCAPVAFTACRFFRNFLCTDCRVVLRPRFCNRLFLYFCRDALRRRRNAPVVPFRRRHDRRCNAGHLEIFPDGESETTNSGAIRSVYRSFGPRD